MALTARATAQIIQDGMARYWQAVHSKTDNGLDATELQWKRDWERDMERWEKKFGAEFDKMFGNSK